MVYIITAVHNRYNITEKFVQNILKQTQKDIKLVLVDDGSTDGTADMVKTYLPEAVILKGTGNLWWGGALHKAYKYLSVCKEVKDNDVIMYANDDINMDNDFIDKGIELVAQNANTLVTGCGYSVNSGKLIDGPVFYDYKRGEVFRLEPGQEPVNCASTRALMMNYSIYKKIGGFHPVLLPHYASDYEYTIRASQKGFVIKSFPEFKYTYDEGTTGFNDLKTVSLKKIFSKRSRFNPIYRISFMLMVTSFRYIPLNLFYGIKRAKIEVKK